MKFIGIVFVAALLGVAATLAGEMIQKLSDPATREIAELPRAGFQALSSVTDEAGANHR